jgi:prepilin-type N-terminal cleavage/methylation domain-containing protein
MRYVKNRSSGVTLIELVVVVIIIATLAAFAIPNFKSVVRRNRIMGYTSEFVTALQAARSEAIKRGSSVSLVANDGSDFANGWQMITKTFGDEDLPLQESGALKSAKIRVAGMTPDGIVFDSRGGVRVGSSKGATITVIHEGCISSDEGGRRITVNPVGRARTEPEDCIP